MNLKKAYYFAFYEFYQSFEASPSKFWSEWKASLLMDILVGCIIITSGLINTVITKKGFIIFESNLNTWLMVIIISVGNYFIFNHTDRWKKIVSDFNHSKNKNRIAGIIFWCIFFLIIASVVFMFYLMSQIDWKQYR